MRFTLIASVTAMVLPFALAAPTGVVDKRVINCFVAPCPDDEGEFSILPFDPKPTPGPDAPVINCIRAPCDVGPISPLQSMTMKMRAQRILIKFSVSYRSTHLQPLELKTLLLQRGSSESSLQQLLDREAISYKFCCFFHEKVLYMMEHGFDHE
ncbi:hypothetical protein DL96DRAFT_23510 [Flagelloscypha sp. PMI_526]|nr:hypothetical protein DL96DRAFT_23510 [Flagelloscypha sp. PMI_526]